MRRIVCNINFDLIYWYLIPYIVTEIRYSNVEMNDTSMTIDLDCKHIVTQDYDIVILK